MNTVQEQVEQCVALVPDNQKRQVRGALYQMHEVCSDLGWTLARQVIPCLHQLSENDCHAIAGMLGAFAGTAFSRDNLAMAQDQILKRVDQQLES